MLIRGSTASMRVSPRESIDIVAQRKATLSYVSSILSIYLLGETSVSSGKDEAPRLLYVKTWKRASRYGTANARRKTEKAIRREDY